MTGHEEWDDVNREPSSADRSWVMLGEVLAIVFLACVFALLWAVS